MPVHHTCGVPPAPSKLRAHFERQLLGARPPAGLGWAQRRHWTVEVAAAAQHAAAQAADASRSLAPVFDIDPVDMCAPPATRPTTPLVLHHRRQCHMCIPVSQQFICMPDSPLATFRARCARHGAYVVT